MGAAEQATLSYHLTQDTIVLVPLIVLVIYVTLSLIRALIDNAKGGAKEKGSQNNSSDVDTQDNQTKNKLFRPSGCIDQHAEEIQGTVPISTRRKDVSFSSSAEFTNCFSNNGNPAADETLYARTVSQISRRGQDTNVPETSANRGHGEGRKVRGSHNSNNDIREECRQVNTDCTFDPQTTKHMYCHWHYEEFNPFPAAYQFICMLSHASNKYFCSKVKNLITPVTNIFVKTFNSSRPVISACAISTQAQIQPTAIF